MMIENNWIIYLLQVSICQAVYFLFFQLFLVKEKWFNSNRLFLLASVCFSFILPQINVNTITDTAITSPIQIPVIEIITQSTNSTISHIKGFQDIIWYIYLGGVIVFSLHTIIKLTSIFSLIKRSELQNKNGYTLVKTENKQPASFFGYLIWNIHDSFDDNNAILIHEKEHIKQAHSLDILLLEIIGIICWFNPFIHLYKKTLQAVHEFIADQAVTKHLNKIQYSEYLISKAFYTNPIKLSNSFFIHSLLKRRIIMINKTKSKWGKLRYAMIIPLVPTMLWISVTAQTSKQSDKATQTDEKVYVKVDNMPEYPGGEAELFKYIEKNVTYPASAKAKKEQGKVYIQFIIDTEGNITKVVVMRGASPALDKEATRVISAMPKWKPGKQDGKVVNVSYILPIAFRL
jgi:TonB family protein